MVDSKLLAKWVELSAMVQDNSESLVKIDMADENSLKKALKPLNKISAKDKTKICSVIQRKIDAANAKAAAEKAMIDSIF